ncbi:MAG TPA: ABC transporter permease [Polyangiaceae bacterium]|nr:ABC transporter permease [Polyangiaceae bacterium]
MIRMDRVLIVFGKELVDNARDRKAWLMAALYVVIGPLMLFLIIKMAGRVMADESVRSIELPTLGAEHAPSLIEFLKQKNVVPVLGPNHPEQAVAEQRVPAVLSIPSSYAQQLAAGQPAVVQLFHDSSRSHAQSEVQRVYSALHEYGVTVGHLRLLARGIDPSLIQSIAVESIDVATPYSRATMLFGIIPIFLLMALFVGGLYIAIDTTAGERERGSLEPLLLNPLSTGELILGKLFAVATFSVATVLLSVLGFALVLNCTPVDIPRVRTGLSLGGIAWLIAILVPAVYLAAALQIRLASIGRTFREGQTAGQLLMLIPALPGMLELFGSTELTRVKYLPIVSQQLFIESVLQGQSVVVADYAVASFLTLALGVLLTFDTVRAFDRTRILVG